MSSQKTKGFTLIELLIFIVVVSIGLAGVLLAINTSIKSSVDPVLRKQSLAIAESLMDEIIAKEWNDPITLDNGFYNPTTGMSSSCNPATAVRSLWTNICDYNGYTSIGILDSNGDAIPDLSNYKIYPPVKVSFIDVFPINNANNGGLSAQMKKIDVSVTDPLGNVLVITGYRGNY